MDCYFHSAVPSVAVCIDCTQTICATCRDEIGLCPGCRLERRMAAASGVRPGLSGKRGPQNPPPGPQPRASYESRPAPAARKTATALASVSPETRALLGLGYPLWPLAALALLDPKKSVAVRRQATQALAVNFGLFGMWIALETLVHVPLLGIAAWPLLAALFPVWLVATVIYGVRVWQGDDVRVPLVSDWLDEREMRRASESAPA